MITMIRGALADTDVVGSFIYGSVARGTATAASDLDVMVLLARELGDRERDALHERFRALQIKLGFQPDPQYPVELFTITSARAALDADEPDDDQQEIRNALQDKKIVAIASPELDELIAMSGGLA